MRRVLPWIALTAALQLGGTSCAPRARSTVRPVRPPVSAPPPPAARTRAPARARPLPTPPPRRGAICDRRGRVLAAHVVRYNIYAVPRDLDGAGLERLRRGLSRRVGWRDGLRDQLAKVGPAVRGRAVTVVTGMTPKQWRHSRERLRRIPGVWVRAVASRRYPLGDLASHVLGHLGEVSPAELKAGYRVRDRVGRLGVERLYERTLRGIYHGHHKPPTPGRRVVLTLDAELQRAVEKILGTQPRAAAVVVNVHTGQILAMASRPGLPLRRLAAPLGRQAVAKLVGHPHKPFWDRTVTAAMNPGSTYQVVTALAALQSRAPRIPRRLRCRGSVVHRRKRYRCSARHGALTAPQALVRGCRSWFYQVGRRLGVDRLAKMARALGLGQKTGLGLNDEAAGSVPTAAWLKMQIGVAPKTGHALNAAVGQGKVTVTPLQLALLYAALANGGKLYRPQLVLRTEHAPGKIYRRFKPRLRRRVKLSKPILRRIRRALARSVTQRSGRAHAAQVAGLAIAGLTGSGQGGAQGYRPPGAATHAWFAGYAPAAKPEIAVVVLAQGAGAGHRVAAPLAARIFRAYFQQRKKHPQVAAIDAFERTM